MNRSSAKSWHPRLGARRGSDRTLVPQIFPPIHSQAVEYYFRRVYFELFYKISTLGCEIKRVPAFIRPSFVQYLSVLVIILCVFRSCVVAHLLCFLRLIFLLQHQHKTTFSQHDKSNRTTGHIRHPGVVCLAVFLTGLFVAEQLFPLLSEQ